MSFTEARTALLQQNYQTGARMVQSYSDYATGWETMEFWFHCQQGQEFSLLQSIQTSSRAHPESCSPSTSGLCPKIKQLGSEADHSPSYSTWLQMHETTALLADMPSRCAKGQFSLYLITAKPMNVNVNTMGTMLLLKTDYC